MLAQTIGAALAGGTLRGCFREPGTITAGQALLIETMCWVLLDLAFGVALTLANKSSWDLCSVL